MKSVVIIGAGGFAREVLDVLIAQHDESPQFEIQGFVDDAQDLWGTELNGYPVLGGFEWLGTQSRDRVVLICGIGNPATRRTLVARADDLHFSFFNAIHPAAHLTRFVELGHGVVVTAGAVITNQIRIGDHVHVNLNSTIGHDCTIAEFCTLAPGTHVSGNVRIHRGCDVGSGAVLIQGVTVGEWTVIGAGAVVTADVPSNTTAVGVPARVIQERPPNWHALI